MSVYYTHAQIAPNWHLVYKKPYYHRSNVVQELHFAGWYDGNFASSNLVQSNLQQFQVWDSELDPEQAQ